MNRHRFTASAVAPPSPSTSFASQKMRQSPSRSLANELACPDVLRNACTTSSPSVVVGVASSAPRLTGGVQVTPSQWCAESPLSVRYVRIASSRSPLNVHLSPFPKLSPERL